MGGFSSGYYLVMDENYTDIDEATLAANDDEKHYHGQGYLDQHEFVVLGKDHYINLSYTPVLAEDVYKRQVYGSRLYESRKRYGNAGRYAGSCEHPSGIEGWNAGYPGTETLCISYDKNHFAVQSV